MNGKSFQWAIRLTVQVSSSFMAPSNGNCDVRLGPEPKMKVRPDLVLCTSSNQEGIVISMPQWFSAAPKKSDHPGNMRIDEDICRASALAMLRRSIKSPVSWPRPRWCRSTLGSPTAPDIACPASS